MFLIHRDQRHSFLSTLWKYKTIKDATEIMTRHQDSKVYIIIIINIIIKHHHHHNHLRSFFQDYPGEPVPEENFFRTN